MLRILTLIAALLFAGAAAATQTMYVDSPKDGSLNLRTGPSTQYAVIQAMPHGSRVTIYETRGKWAHLRHQGGATGWAHTGWLSYEMPAPRAGKAPALQTLYVHVPRYDGLNLRRGPGTGYPVVLTMAQGSSVELLGQQGSWLFVRHVSGAVGWAHRDYFVTTRQVQKPRPPRRPYEGWGCGKPRNTADWHRCQALKMIDRMERRH